MPFTIEFWAAPWGDSTIELSYQQNQENRGDAEGEDQVDTDGKKKQDRAIGSSRYIVVSSGRFSVQLVGGKRWNATVFVPSALTSVTIQEPLLSKRNMHAFANAKSTESDHMSTESDEILRKMNQDIKVWQHVALECDGRHVSLFVDGTRVAGVDLMDSVSAILSQVTKTTTYKQ